MEVSEILNKLTWKLGGQAGFGIMSAGLVFSRTLSRHGLHVFDTTEHPSLIRGGHNTYFVRAEDEPVYSQIWPLDMLVALNKETIDLHKNELISGGCIIYDGDEIKIDQEGLGRQDIKLFPVSILKMAKDCGGTALMRNAAALGACMGVIEGDFNTFEQVFRDTYKKKGQEILDKNIEIAWKGFEYARNNYANQYDKKIQQIHGAPRRMLINGNTAICIGAIKAGLKFYAAYPMTPASSILHFLAGHEREFNIITKHTEDEIAAMNMIIGAGSAGVRSMVATSGGGFALMVEALSLAGMAEIPLVAVNVTRAGPSTGLPTRQEQSDLQFIMNSGHGEFPKIVVCPGDPEECFYETFRAFNLAEKYQLQVIILSDKYLADANLTYEKWDTSPLKIDRGKLLNKEDLDKMSGPLDYKAFEVTQDGVSPRALPGHPNSVHRRTGNEHDEHGVISEDKNNRLAQMDKRMRKLNGAEAELPEPILFGDSDADITIISWGSTKMPVRQAMKFMHDEGIKVNHLHILYALPFNTKKIKQILQGCKKTLLIEGNKTAQMGHLISAKTGIMPDHEYLKYNAEPFYPEEICDQVKKILNR
ncbi:2-oxoacid:acceptor oxidoreductase subunit alpha [Candidatus Woesearchaeota archaeon]|nr:2-oxoacid:acceptor oxidoreductase subunit alpha [Candidatus Woesearchaeota archaeon]